MKQLPWPILQTLLLLCDKHQRLECVTTAITGQAAGEVNYTFEAQQTGKSVVYVWPSRL